MAEQMAYAPNADHSERLRFIAKEDFYQNYYMTRTKGKDLDGNEIKPWTWNGDMSGCDEGSIDLDIQNGNPNYTVTWTGPISGSDTATSAGAFNINGLSAGDYTITITDVNGCMTDIVITLVDSVCELARGPISITQNQPTNTRI